MAQSAGAFGASDIVVLAALVGTLSFAMIAAIALIRARGRAETLNARLLLESGNLRSAADRAESLLNADTQRLVVWEARGSTPFVVGDLPRGGAPADRGQFVAFGRWLSPASAAELDRAVLRLRERGESFTLALTPLSGTRLEAIGRTVGSRAVVRFRDLTGDRLALAEVEADRRALAADAGALKALLEAVGQPAWIRHADGRLRWVNRAYAAAVEAGSPEAALAAGSELLDTATRETMTAAQAKDPMFRRRLGVVAAGDRLLFDVTAVATPDGGAGVALDATTIEAAQAAVRRLGDFHARTLDQLATAVAVFGPDRRLRSSNAAYRDLFGLDAAFLDSSPDESAILDRLRATRKLPEQVDFRSWKAELLSAYRSLEARHYQWHLPEGQTLRVIANPHPEGGMTWIYENVTERIDLEARYNSLIRVQGETLNHLREGVAVFGSDGRLRLRNPALATIWGLDFSRFAVRPHVTEIMAECGSRYGDAATFEKLTASVAGFDETRATVAGRLERRDGRVIDYATVPLPEGQTMLTFVDITDTVRVERALIEKNEALEAADDLKNRFIQHVSYELRSPLTNIIGFTEMIADAHIGPLNEKQREYVGIVMASSGSLLAIVNDILDLATIDAGIMTLDLAEVDVARTVDASLEGLRDRLKESQVKVDTRIADDIGSVVADEKRLRQILYNLLSNAVTFSGKGGRVVVSARRKGGDLVLEVADEGIGIPDDFIGKVFDRFAARSGGAMRGGAGLGLAIVKSFAELHGGTVAIRSEPGSGTRVTVTLPSRPEAKPIAA